VPRPSPPSRGAAQGQLGDSDLQPLSVLDHGGHEPGRSPDVVSKPCPWVVLARTLPSHWGSLPVPAPGRKDHPGVHAGSRCAGAGRLSGRQSAVDTSMATETGPATCAGHQPSRWRSFRKQRTVNPPIAPRYSFLYSSSGMSGGAKEFEWTFRRLTGRSSGTSRCGGR
jgi:hypothetical protein